MMNLLVVIQSGDGFEVEDEMEASVTKNIMLNKMYIFHTIVTMMRCSCWEQSLLHWNCFHMFKHIKFKRCIQKIVERYVIYRGCAMSGCQLGILIGALVHILIANPKLQGVL